MARIPSSAHSVAADPVIPYGGATGEPSACTQAPGIKSASPKCEVGAGVGLEVAVEQLQLEMVTGTVPDAAFGAPTAMVNRCSGPGR